MKKLLAVLLTLCFALSCTGAFAAGRLSVEQEDFVVISDYSLYGYVYAKVVNVGNKPIKVHAGVMEIFDKEGDTITSTDSMSAYAQYLQPEEYTYVRMYAKLEEVSRDDVDDYMLTVTGKGDDSYCNYRFPCTAEYQSNVKSGYYTYDYVYVTVVNNTEEPVYYMRVVIALSDADGHLLYVTSDSLDSNQALMPGSSLMFRFTVDSDWVDDWHVNQITVADVDAIAYTVESK